MKILLINKYHFLKGGAERAYFDMAQMLIGQGHSVAFFSMQHRANVSTPWQKYFIENIEYQEKSISLFRRFSLIGKIWFNIDAMRKLDVLLKEFQPDVAHVHNIYHQLSPSILWALKKRKVPIVMTLHDYKLISPNYSLFVRGRIWNHGSGIRCLLDRCVKDSFTKSLVCVIEQWLHRCIGSYKKVDVFISPSQFLIDIYRQHGFTDQIRLLPNPVVGNSLISMPPIREKKTLLFFGRLSREKGVDMLLRVLTHLDTDVKLWIVGDGPERKSLEALVRTYHLTERVIFFGVRYGVELESLKQRAEAILIPSQWYENFPYTLIESLQSGCLVIAANQGGMTERITHGVNGLLYPASDEQALVDTIRSLDSLPVAILRQRARESVSDLQPAFFTSQLIAMYTQVIQK
ncbi:MAG: glycosyltransferase [Minisyncoccota bacterium]